MQDRGMDGWGPLTEGFANTHNTTTYHHESKDFSGAEQTTYIYR